MQASFEFSSNLFLEDDTSAGYVGGHAIETEKLAWPGPLSLVPMLTPQN